MSLRAALMLTLMCALLPAGAGEVSPAYLSPVALAAAPDGRSLYVAQSAARSIAVFDTASGSVRQTIPLPDAPTGLAISPDGTRLFATGGVDPGRVHVVDTGSGRVVGTLRTGHSPNAPVVSGDGNTLFVCNRFSRNVSVFDVKSGTESARTAVGREPVAAALSLDGGRLFVAHLLPDGRSDSGDVGAEVSVLDTRTRRTVARIRLPDGSSGVRGLCLSPDGRYVYVTHLLSRYNLPASQIERGWIQTNAFSILDAASLRLAASVLLDEITQGAANPWAIACTGDGKYLAVAHAGTHEISLIDRAALHGKLGRTTRGERVSDVSVAASDVVNDMTFLTGIRTRVPLQGNGPRSMAVVGSMLYAGEHFTDSLGVLDLAAAPLQARSVALGAAVPLTARRKGEMLFHDAQYCYQKWLSCSSCHPSDARPDGLNWDLMLDGVGNGKNTKSLLLAHQTPPTSMTGIRPNAEASVRAGYRTIQFAHRPEVDAAAVDEYLKSLAPVPSPYLQDGKLSAAALRGKKLFDRAGCPGCHAGRLYTDLHQYNVGTGRGKEKDTAFDTPTLIEVWRTAPYLHDGRAATLKEVFTSHRPPAKLTAAEIDDLIAFVLSL